jgi:hypothetical protein
LSARPEYNTALVNQGVDIPRMSQSSSEARLSIVVDGCHLEKAKAAPVAEFPPRLLHDVILSDGGLFNLVEEDDFKAFKYT